MNIFPDPIRSGSKWYYQCKYCNFYAIGKTPWRAAMALLWHSRLCESIPEEFNRPPFFKSLYCLIRLRLGV